MKSQIRRFLKALEIQHPILQAPMAGASTVELAATITNNGGIGGLPLGAFTDDAKGIEKTYEKFTELVESGREKIVNLNFFTHEEPKFDQDKEKHWIERYNKVYQQNGLEFGVTSLRASYPTFKSTTLDSDVVRTLIKIKPKIISFHFGLPDQDVLQRLQEHGLLVFITVTNIEELKQVLNANVDGVILQGWEAGGHRGNFIANDVDDEKLSTEDLVKKVTEYLDQNKVTKEPFVVAAGGIHDKQIIQKYLSYGIAGVQLGTIWLPTSQVVISPKLQQLIETSTKLNTIMVPSVSGRNLRTVETDWLKELSDAKLHEIPDYPLPYNLFKQLASDAKISGLSKNYGALLAGDNYYKSWKGTNDPVKVFNLLTEGLKY